MSLKSRPGKLAVAGLTAAAAFGMAASSASAAKLTLNYDCKYPLIGVQPLKVDIDAGIPTSWATRTPTPAFTIGVTATAGGSTAKAMQLIGAKTLEGTSRAGASLNLPNGTKQAVRVPIAINNWTSPGAVLTSPLVLKATGTTPALTFQQTGTVGVTVDEISLNLTARNASGQAMVLQPQTTDINGAAAEDSDEDPSTFDVSCKLNPGSQSTKLADISVTDTPITSSDTTAPSTPGTVQSAPTATSAALKMAASSDNVGVTAYDVYRGATRIQSSPSPEFTLVQLAPSSNESLTVVARDAAGNQSEPRSFSVSTPANVVSSTNKANYVADLGGSATMKTLITGNLPLKGGIVADMTIADGNIVADLTLRNSLGRLNAAGFLPVTATVGFVNGAKTTGTLSPDGVLTTNSLLRIKLIDVKLFGAIPLAGGNNCQTTSYSKIQLKSAANFDPVKGGDITGTFAISPLNNCGILTGIVSPLTSGGGNTIKATLAPKL